MNAKYKLTIDMTKWESSEYIDSFYFYIGSLDLEVMLPLNPNDFKFCIDGEELLASIEEGEVGSRVEFNQVSEIASTQTIDGYITAGAWEQIGQDKDLYFIFYSLRD